MPISADLDIKRTGGQIDGMVLALIDAAFDKEENVRECIQKALHDIGSKQCNLVLSSCHQYMQKHAKLSHGHRVVILKSMTAVIQTSIDQVDKSLAIALIKQASAEMTETKEVVPEWQTAASGVLVALGQCFCSKVMDELLQKFQPGVLPHFFVVQTMANMATVNVFDMVPFIKVVIGSMLPMLGMCKQDNMRWVFSSALGKFSEAILDYVANIEKAKDQSVRREAFSSEVDSAYDVLFNVWLGSREAKLRLAIVEALGQMSHIMSVNKLQAELPKLLPGIIGLYKKHQDPFHITQGLCMVLDACTDDSSRILDTHVPDLLSALFPQICATIDYTNPMTVKNHNEVLRSFAVLCKCFSDQIIGFLLEKLSQPSEKLKTGSLSVIRHLLNSAGKSLEDKQQLILSGLKMVLHDPSNKVKKVLAQVVIAMAHHGYLEQEGGDLMVEFIVRQCALPSDANMKRPADVDHVSNDALRAMCENVLQLLCTTVENMDAVLWPHLLEYLTPEDYYNAAAVLCKNVTCLADRKRGHDDFEVDFDADASLPKPCAILSRLLVLCGFPQQGRGRGLYALQCMRALAPIINEHLVELWDKVIPKLISYIQDAEEKGDGEWSQKGWEDLLLKLLSKSLEQIGDEAWYTELGNSLSHQLALYDKHPTDKASDTRVLTRMQHREKNFLYKCLGVIMRRSTSKDFVSKNLATIFATVKHDSQVEREGCALACGFTAAAHIDLVVDKVAAVSKNPDPGKRSSGLFSFIKDFQGEQKENVKATVMLCYGYVTLFAPPELITSRLEATVMRNIVPQFSSVKDTVVKQNLTRAVELIGRALHPEHLKQEHVFTYRDDLLKHMQNYMKAENPAVVGSETRVLVLDACSALVKLEPALSEADFRDLLSAALLSVLSLPGEGGGAADRGKKEEPYQELLEQDRLTGRTVAALSGFVHELLLHNLSSETLDTVLDHLSPWMTTQQEVERMRAVSLSLSTLQLFLERCQAQIGKASTFTAYGSVLGRLLPRCTDPALPVRQTAVDCVHTVLRISFKFQGKEPDFRDQMVDALPTLKERLRRSDPNALFAVVNDLAKVLGKKTPSEQLSSLVTTTLQQLSDPHHSASSGVCVVLNGLLKARGAQLTAQVEELFVSLVGKLEEVSTPQTRTGTLRCVRTLATHHFTAVLGFLYSQHLPYNSHARECWAVIGQDKDLVTPTLEHLLDTLMRTVPYEEKHDEGFDKTVARTATVSALGCICALTELFRVPEAADAISNIFPRLLAAILLGIASFAGAKPPKVTRERKDKKGKVKRVELTVELDPATVAVEACRTLLQIPQCKELSETLEQHLTWTLLADPAAYAEGATTLARSLVVTRADQVGAVIGALMPAMSSPYEPQRIMTAAVFAELINNKCGDDESLVELLMNALLGKLVDSALIVRKYCIRGLGCVASAGAELMQKFSTAVLSAMMAGMDDKEDSEDEITLEAMTGLSRILAVIHEEHIRAILINVALRIRPCFEKEKANIRNAAFTLFGNLARFGDGQSRDTFLEQIHSNLVSLLLHLNDPDADVRKSCKTTLRHIGPLVGSQSLNTMFQNYLIESAGLHYGEFMNDLSKILIQDFEEKLNFYLMGCANFFKSSWPEIRANAALFTGFMLGNMREDDLQLISREHVCSALVHLLKDTSTEVRVKASEAVSLMHHV